MSDSSSNLHDGDRPSPTETGISTPFLVGFTLVGLALLVGLIASLNGYGRSSRSGPVASASATQQGVTVEDAAGLFGAWERAGVRGRILVQATSKFGFQTEMLGTTHASGSTFPLRLQDTRAAYLDRANRGNRAYVAMFTGIFRKESVLMSQADFDALVQRSRAQNLPDISPDGRSILSNYEGYVRRIAATPERVSEPVVLDVDASYFAGGTPEELMAQLQSAGYEYALVTYDLASDDASVTPEMRSKLESFRTAFSGGGAK